MHDLFVTYRLSLCNSFFINSGWLRASSAKLAMKASVDKNGWIMQIFPHSFLAIWTFLTTIYNNIVQQVDIACILQAATCCCHLEVWTINVNTTATYLLFLRKARNVPHCVNTNTMLLRISLHLGRDLFWASSNRCAHSKCRTETF